MNEATRTEILNHAKAEFPREACGLVVNVAGKEVYRPCRNDHAELGGFVMNAEDYARAEDLGQIMAIVHSHCNVPAAPSEPDLVACESSKLPWVIVSLPSETWAEFRPSGYKAPLLGRTFSHGILDCYTLVRDWYREVLDHELPDYERADEWWKSGGNLYLENFEAAGFVRVDEIRFGDIILMAIGSRVVNHAGVYIGNGMMIHHPQGRLSCRVPYGGYWKKNTRMVVRYKGAL